MGFLLMLATLVFVVGVAWWLRFELKRRVSLTEQWHWLAALVTIQVTAKLISLSLGNSHPLLANIELHSVGGGVVSACAFFYLSRTFKLRVNYRLELVLVFSLAAGMGVLNEISEFVMELLHLGIFSMDTHDTWRDLTSNSVGAIVGWLVIRCLVSLRKQLQKSA